MEVSTSRLVLRTFSRSYFSLAETDSLSHSIEYQKKKDKLAQITFKKDEMVKKDDVYKSSTVSVCTGEPANSISMPPARRKPGAIRPIANGKLLRSGGPSNTASVRTSLCSSVLADLCGRT